MSRCKNCLLSFEEENDWQDFCSLKCAKDYFLRGMQGAALIQGRDDFEEWIANPKNARTVRLDGEPATKPPIGTMVDKIFYRESVKGRGKKAIVELIPVKRKVNVGGRIRVRPMTDHERKTAIHRRGRASFGENMVENQNWRDLPSSRGLSGLGWFPHDY